LVDRFDEIRAIFQKKVIDGHWYHLWPRVVIVVVDNIAANGGIAKDQKT
jgi:hypothetical protein